MSNVKCQFYFTSKSENLCFSDARCLPSTHWLPPSVVNRTQQVDVPTSIEWPALTESVVRCCMRGLLCVLCKVKHARRRGENVKTRGEGGGALHVVPRRS